MNCADKFLKHSERVGARFAELNAGSSLFLYCPSRIISFCIVILRAFSPSEAMNVQPGKH